MDTKNISISDYNYELPDERIAKFPVSPRDHSKLLVFDNGQITDDHFFNLAQHLPKDALMVFNNTKVIRARLHFRKETGAHIEVFLLEPYAPAEYEQMFLSRGRCQWLCLVGNLKKWKGEPLTIDYSVHHRSPHALQQNGELQVCNIEEITANNAQYALTSEAAKPIATFNIQSLTANHMGTVGTSQLIEFEWDGEQTFAEILEQLGQLPIPPYLNRETQQSDLTTYQTVYSKIKGSVAAPTAGLHFTPEVLTSLDAHGIDREELTLHVGAGTFKPVKSDTMGGHVMHSEHICVRRQTIEKLLKHNCQAIAVGTTSVRTLESLYYMGVKVMKNPNITEDLLHVDQWEPYENEDIFTLHSSLSALLEWMDCNGLETLHASTQIIIAPGYTFHIVKYLVTNFHQPQSTLLLLVSAFTKDRWRDIYRHALDNGYRFLSYGDSSLLKT